MKKHFLFISSIFLCFITFVNCGVQDALEETADALECANLIERINDDDDTCAEAIANLNKIEKSCGEFLTDEVKEKIAFLRSTCEDN